MRQPPPSAKKITSPLVYSGTGEMIFPGFALGSELGWGSRIGGPEPSSLNTDYFKYVVFENPNWDWRTFNLESDAALAEHARTLRRTPAEIPPSRQQADSRRKTFFH